jgi:hypothetical protein
MASPTAATPDTPITLKVNYDGVTRRFKLPLRELGAASLEEKVSRDQNTRSFNLSVKCKFDDVQHWVIPSQSDSPVVIVQE